MKKTLKQDIFVVIITLNVAFTIIFSIAAYKRYRWLNTTVESFCYIEQSEYDRIMGIEKEPVEEVEKQYLEIQTHYDEVTIDGIMIINN